MRDSAIFFGGLALGVLLAAACGFDLFPDRRSPTAGGERPAVDRGAAAAPSDPERQLAAARVERERLVWELEKLRDEARAREQSFAAGDRPPGGEENRPDSAGPAAEGDQVLALEAALRSSAWGEAADLAGRLLSRGEAGFPLLLEAFAKVLPEGGISRSDRMPYPLVRVAAKHEREVAALISHALASPAMADPEFSGLVFRLAPEFLASVPEAYPEVRADLAQRLLAALEEGAGKNTWWVLHGLAALGVDAGVESLSRILADPAQRELEGAVILHLGRIRQAEAAQALASFVEGAADLRPSAAAVALRELARQQVPEAEASLRRFLESDRRDLRDAANLAWFSRPRERADAPLAARFLDSDSGPQPKRRLVSQLRDHSPAILLALRSGAEPLRTSDARALVAREEVPAAAGVPAKPTAGQQAPRAGSDR